MLFTQIEFGLLILVTAGFLLSVRHHRAQKVFLLAASYYFYAYWDWRFLGLIILSTLIDYVVGWALKRTVAPGRRRMLLLVSLTTNLGLLGVFKYLNFFIESFAALIEPLGWHTGALNIVLPVGISFYTFQTLSYTIDVYRGHLKPCEDFLDFSLFVAFFPQLVAGPIVRAADFLPQLESPRQLSWRRAGEGLAQFTVGMFKKAFIADNLALYVDHVFANPGVYDGTTLWLAVGCYAVQIYCDFSGYSDMAIGVARALGYDLAMNFNYPYLASNITDFWRRWHISLSTWLRDYLYIPLGGNRKGTRRQYINLMLTMVLGGLWHGAAWNFVLWGTLHGVALAVHKAWTTLLGRGRDHRSTALATVTGWALTMLLVLVAWVFFRAQGFAQAAQMLYGMFWATDGVLWLHPFAIGALCTMAAAHFMQATALADTRRLPIDRLYTPVVLFTMWYLVLLFPARGFQPFIYFQF